MGPWAIIGRFGGKYEPAHFRWPYLEVDLDDMRPADRLFGILGIDGALQFHLPSTKFPLHYLVDSQALISLSEMRNGVF